MRYVLCFLLLARFFFLPSPVKASAVGQIVIVSQVRGKECCDPGTNAALDLQLDTLQAQKLTATFALRYDALEDSHVLSRLKDTSSEKAAFLEITPSLASRSGVLYRGPIDRWYKAGNAYLVGYDPTDRRKIIDTYMMRFHSVFGQYPHSTVAWMIDSESLSYLHEKYGITTHELTREQWGTDSYTLYGGPVNVPYYPSHNWPLIPASTRTSALPLLIVRQTITDPLFTYGDEQSSFTSQPNDYMFGKKDLSYFKQAIQTAMESTYPTGFGVIGLETSMEEKYQHEFARQLEYIATQRDQKKVVVMTLASLSQLHPITEEIGKLSAYTSSPASLKQQAIWINAPAYRARLIANGTQVILTDLRVYSDDLEDPYAATRSSTLNAYWIAPFLLDGSRYRKEAGSSIKQNIQSFLSGLHTQKRESSNFNRTQNDFGGNATGLEFPERKEDERMQLHFSSQEISAEYESTKGKVTLRFFPEEFSVNLPKDSDNVNTLHDGDIEKILSTGALQLSTTTQGTIVTYRPQVATDTSIHSLRAEYPQLYSPERSNGVVDLTKSAFLVVNKRAIVGRNPVRIVLRLQDADGVATLSEKEPIITLSESTVQQKLFTPESAHGEYYVDLVSDTTTKSSVKITVDGKDVDLGTVYFLPNCLRSQMICLRHPTYFFQFILSKYDEVVRKVTSR